LSVINKKDKIKKTETKSDLLASDFILIKKIEKKDRPVTR